MIKKKIIILGAGGRDFHNFNVYFKDNPYYEVVGFTATQIPNIANRIYPPSLAGYCYPKGITIFPEQELPNLIKKYDVNEAVFAYSDIQHLQVMHLASLVLSSGASFRLMGPKETQLISKKQVLSVCAVRTGCGKSKLTIELARILRNKGKKIVIVRHPMPYGNLGKQIVQRFENIDDLKKADCTIEEREEYEPLINEGFTVFAGVDYQKILNQAEKEADLIMWDGGNNDFPFFKPNFHVVICDPHRPGHELAYHPGETNLRMANLVVVSKINTAKKEDIETVLNNIKSLNPGAKVLMLESKITINQPELIKNKEVLVVEDGPTVTHGEMPYGVGYLAAKKFGAKKIMEPKEWAKGEIKKAFEKYAHLTAVLPALGYGEKEIKDLEASINAVPCQAVLSATPTDLSHLIRINKPIIRVSYEISDPHHLLTKILKDAKLI